MKRVLVLLLSMLLLFAVGCNKDQEATESAEENAAPSTEQAALSEDELVQMQKEAAYLKEGLKDAQTDAEGFLAKGAEIDFSEMDILKAAVERGVYPNEAQGEAAYEKVKAEGLGPTTQPITDEEIAAHIGSDDPEAIEDYRWFGAVHGLLLGNIYNYDLVEEGLPMAMLPEDIAKLAPGLEDADYDDTLLNQSKDSQLSPEEEEAVTKVDNNWRELQGLSAE